MRKKGKVFIVTFSYVDANGKGLSTPMSFITSPCSTEVLYLIMPKAHCFFIHLV